MTVQHEELYRQPERHGAWWPSVAGAVTTAGVLTAFYLWSYSECLRAFFHFDDFWGLARAAQIHVHSPVDVLQIFQPTHGFVLYRPISMLYFYLLRLTAGYNPVAYHATQLGFHVFNAFLVYAIADVLLLSRARALACALVYASAPGHAIAVYWNALFTMTGTACLYFVALWVWLRLESRWRAPLTLLAFIGALLAGEHAVSFPIVLTLAAVLLPAHFQWRRLLREQAAFYALAGAYVGAKLYYFRYLLPLSYPDPVQREYVQTMYSMTFNPVTMVRSLGRYVGFVVDATYALAEDDTWALILGASVGVIAIGSTLCVLTGRWTTRPVRAATFGLDAFIVTLGPVLVLRAHVYSYYSGISGLGMALALIGFASVLRRGSTVLPALIAVALLVVHMTWSVQRVKQSQEFTFFNQFSSTAECWLYSMHRVAATRPVTVVVIPQDWLSIWVFDAAESHRLFLCADYAVRTTTAIDDEHPGGGRVVLREPVSPARLPRSRDWMSAAALRGECPPSVKSKIAGL